MRLDTTMDLPSEGEYLMGLSRSPELHQAVSGKEGSSNNQRVERLCSTIVHKMIPECFRSLGVSQLRQSLLSTDKIPKCQ